MPDDSDDAISGSATAHLELFVEPFAEANPGPHVVAAVDALEAIGLPVDLGALATTADGPIDEVVTAAGDAIRRAFLEGATAIQLRIELD